MENILNLLIYSYISRRLHVSLKIPLQGVMNKFVLCSGKSSYILWNKNVKIFYVSSLTQMDGSISFP